MIKKEGFTLLELMIVIIIIGILAALAIPRYISVTEKAKGAEAIANLGILRSAEIRYFAEYDTYTSTLSRLDVEDPNAIPSSRRHFSYYASGSTSESSLYVTGSRLRGTQSGRYLRIDYQGRWTGTWPWRPR